MKNKKVEVACWTCHGEGRERWVAGHIMTGLIQHERNCRCCNGIGKHIHASMSHKCLMSMVEISGSSGD